MEKLYKNVNGKRVELTELEVQEYLHCQEINKSILDDQLKQQKIAEYKEYLSSTDYVVVKISEAIASNDVELLTEQKNKYSDVLVKRKETRENINILKRDIKNKN